MDLPANAMLDLNRVHPDEGMYIGGRAARLAMAHDLGFEIPDGFVVSTELFELFLEQTSLDDEIQMLLLARTEQDTEWKQTAEAIAKRIRDTKIPDEIAQLIMKRYVSMGGFMEQAEVVIRPSLTSAWQPAQPHLGHLDSYYHIKGESNVVWMIRECWVEFFSAKLLKLREKHHIHDQHLGMAVLVEESLDPAWSGVAISLYPATSDSRLIVVEAVVGLWEISQHEAVEPDHYLIKKDSWEITEKRKGVQKHVVSYKKGKPVVLDVEQVKSHYLDNDQAVSIAKMVRQLEHRYRKPVEIDWGIVKKKVVILGVKLLNLESNVVKGTHRSIRLKKLMQAEPGYGCLVSGPVAEFRNLQAPGVIHPGAIAVVRYANPALLPVLRHAAGLIVEEGGQASYAAIVARELGLPCVVGAHGIMDRVDTRLPITIDGEQGIIYEGTVRTQRGHVTLLADAGDTIQEEKEIRVAMPLVVMGERLTDWHDVQSQSVALSWSPDAIIREIGVHPEWLGDRHKLDEVGKRLAETIGLCAKKMGNREMIVNTSDLWSNDYRKLQHGEQFETNELNPLLGFHGAQRLLANYEQLDVELLAVKSVRQKQRLSNVSLALRGIRHPRQVMALKKYMSGDGLMRGGKFRLYVVVETPHMAMQIKELHEIGIDGVIFDLAAITRLFISYEPVPWDDKSSVENSLNLIINGVREAKKLRVKRYLRVTDRLPAWIWTDILKMGCEAIEMPPDLWNEHRSQLAKAEELLLSK